MSKSDLEAAGSGHRLIDAVAGLLSPCSVRQVVGANEIVRRRADLVAYLPGTHVENPTDDALYSWIQASRRALLLMGDEASLVSALQRLGPELELYPVERAAGASTLVVLKPPDNRGRRDYKPSTLHPLLKRHPDVMRLLALRITAWKTTGFYPDHAPRLWEYPVVSRALADAVPAGSRIVDIGAGVNPLVPYLTTLGYLVETVDPSPTIRLWPAKPRWGEWGYLDYNVTGLAHSSWNCTLQETPDDVRFAAAYSVSVIEHIKADDRRAMLAAAAARMRPQGMLVLTVDLKRGTSRLWNRCLGEVVESWEVHGTFADLQEEIHDAGFDLCEARSVRNWGNSRVDIGYVTARRR